MPPVPRLGKWKNNIICLRGDFFFGPRKRDRRAKAERRRRISAKEHISADKRRWKSNVKLRGTPDPTSLLSPRLFISFSPHFRRVFSGDEDQEVFYSPFRLQRWDSCRPEWQQNNNNGMISPSRSKTHEIDTSVDRISGSGSLPYFFPWMGSILQLASCFVVRSVNITCSMIDQSFDSVITLWYRQLIWARVSIAFYRLTDPFFLRILLTRSVPRMEWMISPNREMSTCELRSIERHPSDWGENWRHERWCDCFS